jgi:hypothetical protein
MKKKSVIGSGGRLGLFGAIFLLAANVSSAAENRVVGDQGGSQMGLKNFREILSSLSAVTGVPVTSPDVSAYYGQIASGLPRYGNLSEFNPQSLLADIGLGSVFCNHLIATDLGASGAAKSGPNAGIDFHQGPSHVSATQRGKLAQNYIDVFLQRSATTNEQTQLTQLFGAMSESTGDSGDETQASVLAVCSAVAGSIEFLSN